MKTQITVRTIGLAAALTLASMSALGQAPIITNITMIGRNPRLTIASDVGSTNQVRYIEDLTQTNWTVLTNLVVTQSPYLFVDASTPPALQRFYRVVAFRSASMVLIPAGSFIMGNCMNPGEGYSDELPLHTVSVSAFYMDRYEVTKTLWDTVYTWATNHGYSFDNAGLGKAADHPAQTVSWYDGVKWCNARSEKEGLTPAYYTESAQTHVYRTGQTNVLNDWVKWTAGYRLPTEAEWEKAVRGGASGHRFPWSDADTISHSRANYYAGQYYSYDLSYPTGYHPAYATGGVPYTSPVGSFTANGYGLYDMAGNVFEWCWDWYDSSWYGQAGATQTDTRGPAGPLTGRVMRGGCWGDVAGVARCAFRNPNSPSYAYYVIGFRCVKGL